MTPRFHTLTVKEVRRETKDVVSIAFDLPENLKEEFSFIPGQNLTIKKIMNGEEIRRSYSLCTAPYENDLRVAVKQITDGKFSTFANNEIKAGDELEVMTPNGHFTFKANPAAKNSYVLFAAGSGITPIMSILKEMLTQEPMSDVTLFFGNSNYNSIIFSEEIEGLKNNYMNNFRVIHVLSRENLGNDIQKGRIDEEKSKKLYQAFLKDTPIDAVYVCGPEGMIHAVKDSFTALGVPAEKIHFELFITDNQIDNKKATYEGPSIHSNVKVIIDDDEFDISMDSNETNILDAAIKGGADLPFSCKGGVCCTCKAKVLEGEVRMDVNYALTPEEVEAGYILTCQSHPTTETLVVSFDE